MMNKILWVTVICISIILVSLLNMAAYRRLGLVLQPSFHCDVFCDPLDVKVQGRKINSSFFLGLETSLMSNATVILYNRVPKCGSTTFGHLIKRMSTKRHFTMKSSKIYRQNFLSPEDQRKWINNLRQLKRPFIYERHIWFVNFTDFMEEMPVYINLIREPVERFVSWFYYEQTYVRRSHWPPEMRNITIDQCIERGNPRCTQLSVEMGTYILIPYFCGQHEFCKYPSRRALLQAKANAIQYTAIIGTVENFDMFLQGLEHILPQYFEGILRMNQKQKRLNRRKGKDSITPGNRERLKKLMNLEYEFYEFVQSRLLHLHNILKNHS